VSPPGPDPRFRNSGPPYPELARALGQQGTVGLLLEITAEGRVAEARVVQSSGHPILDSAARQTALGWRFRPATRDNAAVADRIRTSVVFRLE